MSELENIIKEFVQVTQDKLGRSDTRLAIVELSIENLRKEMVVEIKNAVREANEECRRIRRRQVARALARKADKPPASESPKQPDPAPVDLRRFGVVGTVIGAACAAIYSFFAGGK